MKDVVVLIPALNPTENLYKLVTELINLQFKKILPPFFFSTIYLIPIIPFIFIPLQSLNFTHE